MTARGKIQRDRGRRHQHHRPQHAGRADHEPRRRRHAGGRRARAARRTAAEAAPRRNAHAVVPPGATPEAIVARPRPNERTRLGRRVADITLDGPQTCHPRRPARRSRISVLIHRRIAMSRGHLITGITGQDGSYLAEFLLEQGLRSPRHGPPRQHRELRADRAPARPHSRCTRPTCWTSCRSSRCCKKSGRTRSTTSRPRASCPPVGRSRC